MTGPIVEQKPIALYNAFVARQEIRYFSTATNDWESWSGSNVQVRFSRFKRGYDFNGYPSTLFGPFTMIETSEPGWFAALISSDDVTDALGALIGQTIYMIVEGAYGAAYYDLTSSQPLLVIDPRVPVP